MPMMGINVITLDAVFTLAAITLLAASFNWNVVAVTVDGLIDFIKVCCSSSPGTYTYCSICRRH